MQKHDTRDCEGRTPPHHFDMRTFPLVEKKAGQGDLALSVSYYLPGGGAEFGPQPVEVIFYVLDGVISIETDDGDITLEPGQAVHIHKGENKGVHNRTNAPASMLVIAKVPDEMAH